MRDDLKVDPIGAASGITAGHPGSTGVLFRHRQAYLFFPGVKHLDGLIGRLNSCDVYRFAGLLLQETVCGNYHGLVQR